MKTIARPELFHLYCGVAESRVGTKLAGLKTGSAQNSQLGLADLSQAGNFSHPMLYRRVAESQHKVADFKAGSAQNSQQGLADFGGGQARAVFPPRFPMEPAPEPAQNSRYSKSAGFKTDSAQNFL